MNDTHAVQIGSVAASMYALVADGKNGLRVLQLISPDTVEGAAGFSPRPSPRLIATYPTQARRRSPSRAGSIAIAWWMRPATRPSSSAAAARVRSISTKCARSSGTRDGTLYRVEDVSSKDGKLVTKSGRELKPSPTPQAPAPPNPGATTDIGALPRKPAGPRAEAGPAFR